LTRFVVCSWVGCAQAVKNVNEVIAPKIIGKDVTKQEELDNLLLEIDGTENKGNLGYSSPHIFFASSMSSRG
jgi:enolase